MANMANQDSPQPNWPGASNAEGSAARQPQGAAQRHHEPAPAREGSASLAERSEKAADQVAGSAIEQVRAVQSGLSQQRGQLAQRVRRVGDAMRESGAKMGSDDETASEFFRFASRHIEDIASYVDQNDLSAIASDAREFVRKRPAVFFGGAFLLGLAAGRFLKASGGAASPRPGQLLDPAAGVQREPKPPAFYGSSAAPAQAADTGVRRSIAVPGTPSKPAQTTTSPGLGMGYPPDTTSRKP